MVSRIRKEQVLVVSSLTHTATRMITCHLEFECTNNVAKYEALVQGLRKALDLKIKCLEVFRDSQIVTCQVRNSVNALLIT